MDKKLIIFVLLLASAMTAVARPQYEDDEETVQRRAREKRIEAIRDSMRAVEAFNALQQYDFVIEADRLSFKYGETAYVTSSTNFISLKGDRAVIQIAPFHGGGPNGVGGITLEGRATNVKLKTDKKGNSTLTMNVSGAVISATVSITLPKNGYMATAIVNSNFRSNRITLYGTLLPTSKSDIFKGRSF